MPKASLTQHERERALFRYRNALLCADFDNVASVLRLAERDTVLWQMLQEINEEDDALLESDINDASLLNIIAYSPSSNGASPKTHSKEDKLMILSISKPKTQTNTRLFGSFAAALMLLIFAAMLLIAIALPIDTRPAQVVELTQPALMAGCQLTTTAPANEESLRLVEASREAQLADNDELALLLGICALQTAYTQEADWRLQAALVAAGLVPDFPVGNSAGYQGVELSPDGNSVLTINDYVGARLWDIATGETIRTFPYNDAANVTSVAFSPDGKYALVTIETSLARLWEIDTGTPIADFDAGRPIFSMAISPDGRQIAMGLYGGQVKLWNMAAGTIEASLPVGSAYVSVSYVAFSPDSRRLLVASDNPGLSALQLWDIETGEKIREFSGLQEPQTAIFSPDSHYVIAGGSPTDPRAVMWDAETGEVIRTFLDLTGASGVPQVHGFAFSPDARYVLIGSANHTFWIFELETGIEVRRFPNQSNTTGVTGFSPDGKRVLIAGRGSARIWSTDYRDSIADACRGVSRDFTAEERAQYGLRDAVPTCPQFAEGYALEAGMTAIPTQPIPVWTALPTMESSGE
jgi:DNA-binding beta-propeller fold protein YncE